MKKILWLNLITGFAVMALSCKGKENAEAVATPGDVSGNLNVSILLDLSDRISPDKYPNSAMQYFERDAGYINSVAGALTDHLKSKKVRQAKDRIQLFFDPAPQNPEINTLSKKLKISVDRNNVSKELIAGIGSTYESEPKKIYELAIKDKKYIGSDTWKFFKNKIDTYCIEPGHRNILVVLTDGYIFYKDSKMQDNNLTTWLTPELIRSNGLTTQDWNEKMQQGKFGFIPANTNLSNVEILVLGINPDPKNPYEEEVIKAYWNNWLNAMKVKRFEIYTAELPSDMDQVIRDFIRESDNN